MTTLTLDKPLCTYLRFNQDKLSSIIRGCLSEYYNQTMNSEIMESLTHKIVDDIDKLVESYSE